MELCRSHIPCGSEPARDGVLPNTESFPSRYSTFFRTVRNMIYFVRSYATRASQPSANKLSTPPPTANGDNCGNAQIFFHTKQRKSVTYPNPAFLVATDHFLIYDSKAALRLACRGSRTPYPQMRQQRLGATSSALWKTAESRDISSFVGG